MDTDHKQTMNEEEQKAFLQKLDGELALLKYRDPQKYLELIEALNKTMLMISEEIKTKRG